MIRARSAVIAVLLCCVSLFTAAVSVSAQTLNFSPVGTIPGPVDLVRAQGRYVYLASGKTITVFDISNPAAPKRTGSYSFPEKIWGFRLVGSLLYVADGFSGLGILDVSDPAAPTLRGSVKTPGQAHNAAASGTRAVLADHDSGVIVVDISNPSKPVKLGASFVDGYARDVVTLGSMAYAVDNPSGLYVLDLSKPNPDEIAPASNDAAAPMFIEVTAGPPPIAVLMGAGSLQLYDLSNATMPVKLTSFRTPGAFGRVPQRVALKGTLAYVADAKAGLQVVDLSTPSKPRIVGSYKMATEARDVALADSLVIVVGGETRLDSNFRRSETGGEVLILRQTP